jgi:hypothetical protein
VKKSPCHTLVGEDNRPAEGCQTVAREYKSGQIEVSSYPSGRKWCPIVAWLLWWYQKTIHSAHQSKEACENEIEDIQKARARARFEAIPMVCLPDTVDPRGAKTN